MPNLRLAMRATMPNNHKKQSVHITSQRPEAMSKAQLSPEYRAIEECIAYAVDELALDPVSIALNLESAELVSRTDVEQIKMSGASRRAKAEELLGYVLNNFEISSSIEVSSRKYQNFKEILLKEYSRETLVKLLDKTYEGEQYYLVNDTLYSCIPQREIITKAFWCPVLSLGS